MRGTTRGTRSLIPLLASVEILSTMVSGVSTPAVSPLAAPSALGLRTWSSMVGQWTHGLWFCGKVALWTDPFFERQLSDVVQMHVLVVRPYRLPFQRTCNKKGLPSIPVHVVVGDELDTLAMEWTPEGGQRMMRLTLEHVQSMWMVRELCALPGDGALHPRRPTQVCHFIDETGKPRYTYKYLYGPSLDLPAGVHDAVLHRTREIGAVRAALDPPPVRVGQQYRCTICGRDFNGPTQWDDHRFGADHLKKRAALPLG